MEKAGIPTVLIDLPDQDGQLKIGGMLEGVPNLRYVHASRTVPGPEDVPNIIEPLFKALTEPLTEKEKESGRYVPPEQLRVLFEGTLDEAQTFYHQTEKIPFLDSFYAVYTDGLPIVVPTEERVQEMLKGTSHKPDEVIALQSDRGFFGKENVAQREKPEIVKKGSVVRYPPMMWTATVEKVATIAVMAGCKPEYLPVVMAIAESGGGCGDGRGTGVYCLSGPIAKEIGVNIGCFMFAPGNPASKTIGRTANLMWRNLGGFVPYVTTGVENGNPIGNGGLCFAENMDALPPGWKSIGEEYGYKKDESVMIPVGMGGLQGGWFSPGGYRAFQKSGHGGIARRIGVKGEPGPHNWLEYLVYRNALWAGREGGVTFVMPPEMARHLYEYGFKSKDEVYEWLWKKSFEPVKDYRNRSWPDLTTNAWLGIEQTSGKHWKELPDDYMVPAGGEEPRANCIIVAGGVEEAEAHFSGRLPDADLAWNIDAWR